MTDAIFNTFGLILLAVICLFIAYGYIKNILKLIVALREQNYTINAVIRAVGIFFPIVGVIMGFV